jgi:ABC transporter domain protein
MVSHDRFFMDSLVDHLFVFEGDGVVRDFPGNYTQYREWDNARQAQIQAEQKAQPSQAKANTEATSRKPQQERKAKRSYKEEQEFLQLEKDLPLLEAEIKNLEERMSSGALASDELQKAGAQYQLLSNELDEKTMRWLELSELGN